MPDARRSRFSVAVVAVVVTAAGWGVIRIQHHQGSAVVRKAHVVAASAPLTVAVARHGCPIPLPDSASNVQFAVWSFGQVTQSWIRFEASVPDCLAHAERLFEPFREREGYSTTRTPIEDDTGVLCVLDPTEVDLTWFEGCQHATGTVFRVTGGRAPVIWVDTRRGVFYCEVKNACHSLSPP